ncbi:Insecticidal toxin protein [Pseudomonas syringae pv. antirrhini]|uniref:Insecticidal toxin protein n=1 Tax=Pseudomonas syringae pv. antirrhini TaxID=251702 RepID=A0A0P9J5M2_9PSED|nr:MULTISPECIES: RHS repeat-associated core domain-containing protein [Pseudomonas]KPW43907.1 Insecticidal toxin protein [Pseudomonas syringae pv. antirrhini]RMP39751.1 Insecticidal toxin protein [Pseudomonas syringae pv. antirrhini]RMP41572.1 Insecticidal toxin protein [Pseudomonas syringae pv. antirrhini]RMW21234.1 Insecticidal toxin protein [Pseudomonas syringae pv. antirrhini]WIN08302.1 RHS repeat-associated core domain-containing protein [Pseudomonas syringae pv. antirrhini str. 126]
MVESSFILHQHTPALQSVDPRGLSVASILLCRSSIDHEPEMRISQASLDVAGRLVSRWDPRLWADRAPANLSVIHSLSGQVLASDSVDAGWRVSLAGEAGQVLEAWDARGVARRTGYDALLRSTEVFEDVHCVERLLYGGPDSTAYNQCGQLIRHDDPAGTLLDEAFGLSGSVIRQTRRFLHSANEPDWPESLTGRDALLEPGDGATTCWQYSPLNESTQQTDGQGNVRFLGYTVAGQLKDSRLQLNGQAEQVLVSAIQYDAQGRVVSETAGNSVISTARYDTEDGRLKELNVTRSNGQVLQDLRYGYDPVGNVIRVEDRAQPTVFKGNQRIDSVSTYHYDTLYQLIEATGRESAVVNYGPVFPGFQSPADPTRLANYTRTYRYDAGGNLQQLTHTGAQSHSRTLVTARYSNRSLPVINDHIPDEAEIAAAFDANGNLLALQAGQDLSWDRRNQLQQVRPVVRDNAADDSERYIYDASGQRLRKVRTTQAKAVTHIADVRYLPGLEVRTDSATGETLHVVVAQAGRNNLRVLHWASGKPDALENDQTRYTLNDHLGSGTLELDGQAQRVSQERYYPFGGTSWWAGRNAIEASYKTVRYSGKERDATGLYYYGLRYYAPWLQRWINPDPAGAVDGLNMYRMVRNNPVSMTDVEGLAPLFGFEKEVDDARLEAIRALEKTKALLDVEANEDVPIVIKRFFGVDSVEFKARWKDDIDKVLRVARETSMRNVDILDSDKPEDTVTALLDMERYKGFSHYLAATERVTRQSASPKELNREMTQLRKNYRDQRDEKFLRINRKTWGEAKKATGKSFIAQVLIHEFSHAALNTMDYVYGKAKEGQDPTPLLDLAAGKVDKNSATLGKHYRNDTNKTFAELAYGNADSFASAVMYVKRSASKKASEFALYKQFF